MGVDVAALATMHGARERIEGTTKAATGIATIAPVEVTTLVDEGGHLPYVTYVYQIHYERLLGHLVG